jgi:hypothetical protein
MFCILLASFKYFSTLFFFFSYFGRKIFVHSDLYLPFFCVYFSTCNLSTNELNLTRIGHLHLLFPGISSLNLSFKRFVSTPNIPLYFPSSLARKSHYILHPIFFYRVYFAKTQLLLLVDKLCRSRKKFGKTKRLVPACTWQLWTRGATQTKLATGAVWPVTSSGVKQILGLQACSSLKSGCRSFGTSLRQQTQSNCWHY